MKISYTIDLIDVEVEVPQEEVLAAAAMEYANHNGCALKQAEKTLKMDDSLMDEWCDKVEEDNYWYDEFKNLLYPKAEQMVEELKENQDNDFNLGLNRMTD